MITFYDLPNDLFDKYGLEKTTTNAVAASIGVDENKDIYVSNFHTGAIPEENSLAPENRPMLSYFWEGLPWYEHPKYPSGGYNVFIQLQFISNEIKTDLVKETVRAATAKLTRESIEHNPIT